jgi:hypothetical protein
MLSIKGDVDIVLCTLSYGLKILEIYKNLYAISSIH